MQLAKTSEHCPVPRNCTNLGSVTCGYVYRSMFPIEPLPLYRADHGTLASNAIIRPLMAEIEPFEA